MPLAVEFSTITEMFVRLADRYRSEQRPVLMYKSQGKYMGITYAELRLKVEQLCAGLVELGVKRGDHVALVSENRPEWVISDLAIVTLGAVTIPIYPTLTAKQIEYIFKDAGIRLAIVSNSFQLNKVQKIFDHVKSLRSVVVMVDKGVAFDEKVVSYSALIDRQAADPRRHGLLFAESNRHTKPEDLLTILYTSGTTGNPKGVMLTHRNLVSNMHAAAAVLAFDDKDVFLSFLPLCHSFEKMAGYLTAMACGATIAYAESVETVRDNMLEVRPTIMTAVPRFFERAYNRLRKQIEGSSPVQRKIFFWAVDVGRRMVGARRHGTVPPLLSIQHALADKLVHRKIRDRMGGRMRFMVSGGAALAREYGEFFEAMGLKIIEGYGLTESAPVIAANRLDDHKFGTVGKPIPGVEVKIAEDGEILARGPNIMKGYWNDRKATAEAIDKRGWLHTGDIGLFDSDGFLVITDRKKHLFVSSGGKNIAPQQLENLFQQSKYVDQFVLIGDRRMFLSALIVPDFDAIKQFADENRIQYRDVQELVRSEEIRRMIENDIQTLQRDLANYERVRKFVLLDQPFTIETGEMTPTMKVKRNVVEERYRHLIDRMYEGVG